MNKVDSGRFEFPNSTNLTNSTNITGDKKCHKH